MVEEWEKDSRRDVVITDIDALVPKDHLLRKIEKVMDYGWIYERLESCCTHVGRPPVDPVIIIKMAPLQRLYGNVSLHETRWTDDSIAFRWFLGYNLFDRIPHFATVSYAFCDRFPPELTEETFEHILILNKAINNRMVDPSAVFIDGTHIKASANKKKFQKEQVKKAAKVYDEQLRQEVNAEREKLGKKPVDDDEDNEDDNNGTAEKTVSTTDPECGMFVKGESGSSRMRRTRRVTGTVSY